MVAINASPLALFGFDPQLLLGQSMDLFVDVFRQALPPGVASGFNQRGGAERPSSPARASVVNSMLVKLAEK